MEGRDRQRRQCGRPGLTLVELMMAVAFVGVAFALFLPRPGMAPATEPAPAVSQADSKGREVYRPGATGAAICAGAAAAEQGFIGVQFDRQPTAGGYQRIRALLPGGPAQQAGVQPFDLVLKVDGISARNREIQEVVRMITAGRPGTPVRLALRRGGALVQLRVRRGSFLSVFLPGIAARPLIDGQAWRSHF